MSSNLNPEKGLIFRIVHIDNVKWILSNGMQSRNSNNQDPAYRTIGNPELISKRHHRSVPINPGGHLSDYIPFYFTPYSPMMYNIKTGYGIKHVPNSEIVIFVSRLPLLAENSIPFVFTDRHAYLVSANFYSDMANLDQIDWQILQNKDFKRDPNDPAKLERYQAEALVFQHLPVKALIGVVCYTDHVRDKVLTMAKINNFQINVVTKKGWYF